MGRTIPVDWAAPPPCGTRAVRKRRRLGLMNPKRRDVTFLVRMWPREHTDGDADWRGSVHEVSSGKRLFVSETREVADFIAEHLAELRTLKG